MAHTIADITRRSKLPRRTIQFWADREVLQMDADASIDAKERLYSDAELEIACLLRPLTRMALPFNVLQLIAGFLREHGFEPRRRTGLTKWIDMARAGDPVFLIVSIDGEPGRNAKPPEIITWVATGDSVHEVLAIALSKHPGLPAVVVNMTEALRTEPAPKRAGR